jgi:hypothetical protein
VSRADFHCLAYCPIRLPSPNHLTRPIVVRRHYRFAESPATLALRSSRRFVRLTVPLPSAATVLRMAEAKERSFSARRKLSKHNALCALDHSPASGMFEV